jgi:hypothetical protein
MSEQQPLRWSSVGSRGAPVSFAAAAVDDL